MRTQLQNLGYMRADVEVMTKTKGKKLKATYLLHPYEQYYVRNVSYDIRDSAIAALVGPGTYYQTTRSVLRPGMPFHVDQLDAERKAKETEEC